jgi:hypothetical protein
MLSGGEQARGLWTEVVQPLVAQHLPGLRCAAGRLGSGSDVLGLDDETSRDHDWGNRLTLLLDSADGDAVPVVDDLLAQQLPDQYRGYPVRFPTTWDGRTRHRVQVDTVGGFGWSRLGVDPVGDLTVLDWLTLTGQSVLEVIGGPIFADQTREFGVVRDKLSWYPADVERYVLAAGWQRVDQQLPFVGRTGERGDDLGSRLLCATLAADLMWLAFALSRRWPPYPKWRGTVFMTLPVAASLAAPLDTAVRASSWQDREAALCEVIEVLTRLQRAAGFPAPESGVIMFWDRPYRALNPELQKGLLAQITDPEVASLPPGVGCIERWSDNVNVLSSPGHRMGTQAAYRAWAENA